MIGFESPYPVAVSQTGRREWKTTAPLVYHGSRQTFTVEIGSSTDFASSPRVSAWLIPSTVEIASTVLHDDLWRRKVPQSAGLPPGERITYRDADGLLRQALLTQDVGMLTRWVIWAGVRWGALTRPGGWRQWWKDAPAVICISLAMLPLILLPSPVGLPLFKLAELLVSPLDRRRRQLRARRRQLTPADHQPPSTEETP